MLRIRNLLLVGAFMLFIVVLMSCLPTPTAQSPEVVSQATRSAAATAQAEINKLQAEAFTLEEELDTSFSDHYTGILVESYPKMRVIVYLVRANKSDLAPYVTDPKLFGLIEVKEEAVSRQSLREIREALKAEMDKAGMTYTTGIKMEPARLQVYVLNISEAQDQLKAAGISIPDQVELVEMEYLPEGG